MPFSGFANADFPQQVAHRSSEERSYEALIKKASEGGHKQLKALVRRLGLPASHPARNLLWPLLVSKTCKVEIPHPTDDPIQNDLVTNGSTPIFDDRNSNLIGYELSDSLLLPSFYLNEEGKRHLRNILHTIASNHPEIVYAPQLWPIVALFLHYHSVTVSRACILALLSHGRTLIQTKSEWKEHCLALEYLGRMGMSPKSVRRYLKTIPTTASESVTADLDNSKLKLAQWTFVIWQLPFECLVRILDSFIVEGPKVLYRAGLTLLHIAVKHQSRALVSSDVIDLSKAASLSTITPALFLKRMFSIVAFSRTDISNALNTVRDSKYMHYGENLDNLLIHPCNSQNVPTCASYLLPNEAYVHPSECVSVSELSSLVHSIGDARLAQLSKPVLVFSTNRDGISLQTLYSNALSAPSSATILLVRTASNRHVIGAFCTDRWQASNRATYFGTGLCFLFRIHPPPLMIYRWVGLCAGADSSLAARSASEASFQCATMDGFHIGGSGASGQPGLSVDAKLSLGTSGPSPTFNNPCLVSDGDDVLEYFGPHRDACAFRINLVEVLAFVDL